MRDLHFFLYDKIDYNKGSDKQYLGICNMPSNDLRQVLFMDACHIKVDTLPGGLEPHFTKDGITAIHEAGHWFGLMHPWGMYPRTACNGDGDEVDDTVPQMLETKPGTCSPWKDTCPLHDGFDNIHNYMDYSGDGCQNEFTPGQVARMHSMFHEIREAPILE